MSLIENNFTSQDMAHMLGVSKRTIENRMAEYELTNKSRYSDIENDFLDSFVQRIMTNFPRSGKGYTLIKGNVLNSTRTLGKRKGKKR